MLIALPILTALLTAGSFYILMPDPIAAFALALAAGFTAAQLIARHRKATAPIPRQLQLLSMILLLQGATRLWLKEPATGGYAALLYFVISILFTGYSTLDRPAGAGTSSARSGDGPRS